MASENIVLLTDENFDDEVLNSSIPVLVDFWAEWCAPCKRIAPAIEELAAKYEGRLKVGKLNVDEANQTVYAFSIMSIPTILIFKDGEVKSQLVGAMSPPEYDLAINEVF